jgi:probable phosphoglycerate mutase
MSTILLIRHGITDAVGKALSGRTKGVSLSAEGHRQACAVAKWLTAFDIQHVYSSPLERAIETAEEFSTESGLPVRLAPEITEIDFGEWTGKFFSDLEKEDSWQQFNLRRSLGVAPGGESAAAVQQRTIGFLQCVAERHADEKVAIFTHADVIRSALLWCLNSSLDNIHRLEIGAGSASIIDFIGGTPCVRLMNFNAR